MKQNKLLPVVKHVLHTALALAMSQLCLPAVLHAQEALRPPTGLMLVSSANTADPVVVAASDAGNPANNIREATPVRPVSLQSPDPAVEPGAMTLSVHGKCECSVDGVTFADLAKGQILEQGAIVRTGDDARTDLFFRRTGTTVRLQAGTELRIEKLTLTMKDGLPVVHTLLDLRAGRIFTVVRSEVAGSTLEIRNAAGRSVVEGSGVGRYIITADGTRVVATGSVIPLKVIGDNGITVVAAGQQFDPKEGKTLAASPSLWVKDMIELDELQAATQDPAAKELSPKP